MALPPIFDGSDPCYTPEIPVGRDDEWRIREAAFGDGYAQRTLDGINALNITWQVTFENRPADILTQMLEYFAALQGAAFPFQDPGTGVTYQVWCDKWHVDWSIRRKRSGQAAEYFGTLSAEFRKANGVTIVAVMP